MKIDASFKKRLKHYLIKKIKEEERGKIIIQTPYPLTEEDLNFFYSQLPYLKQYVIENQVVSDLIGGFIIQHGSKIIDASVSSQINSLKHRMTSS